MRPVYLLIEEVNRELLSRLLIGRAAAELGHPVLIGQQWWMAANFGALPPGVVLFKGNNRIQALFMQQARKAGHAVASIDEESFVSSSATEIAAQYHALAEEHCEVFFAQGQFQRDAIAARFPAAADRIVTTGNPRADLLRDSHFRPLDPMVERYREEKGPYILINTNFTTINPKLGDVYSYYQTCLRIGVLDDPKTTPFDRFMTWCAWERENLKAIVQLIRMLSQSQDKRRVVLRPHPSERGDVWIDRMAEMPTVDVVMNGDHLAWIDRSDVLLHSGCSTGLEAYLLGRSAVSLTPGDKWWKTPALSNIVNPVATTRDEAMELLERLLDRGLAESAREGRGDTPALDHYLLNETGPPPADRIAAHLSEMSRTIQDGAKAKSTRSITAGPTSKRIIDKAFIDLAGAQRRLDLVERATGREKSFPMIEIASAVFQLGEAPPIVGAVAP
jgi:surface carbohydrate biosynthesis protein